MKRTACARRFRVGRTLAVGPAAMSHLSSPCPFLKEVVMMYCDACQIKKLLPRDHLVSASPCLANDFTRCPLFQDAMGRANAGAERTMPDARPGERKGLR